MKDKLVFLFIFILSFDVMADKGMKAHEIDKTRPYIDRGMMLDYRIIKLRMKYKKEVEKDTFLMPERVKRKIQREVDEYNYWLKRGRRLNYRWRRDD